MSADEPPPAPATARPFWRNPVWLGAAAAAAVLIIYLASQAQTPAASNPPEQTPRTEQGPHSQGGQTGQPDQPDQQGGDGPVAANDGPGGVAQPIATPNTDPAFDMDAWRRKEEAAAEEQRRRGAVPREEERCQNEDGSTDTRSIHTGC